ncbi:MAG: glycerol-3-phosphate acyltransferase, partial [Candidatus Promineofilum sp.]|nr:glycerol-3-phosphate acyltransferase [Promineifilum sp.]
MQAVYFLLAALIGYLCGSIPFGYIYVRLFKGEDLRTIGSGRTGGTNSLRAAGLGVGVLTSLSDVFKGFLAVWLTT